MVSVNAVKLAKHAGRVTVKASDIELAVKEIL
jgi:histone H3/H4